MATTKSDVIEFIKNMSVMELVEFVKELEEIFGVSAAQVIQPGPIMEEPELKPQTEFNVTLKSFAEGKKIPVIKVVREITSLGLKDAKDFVEGVPNMLKEDVSKEEAEKIKEALEKVGGTVEIT